MSVLNKEEMANGAVVTGAKKDVIVDTSAYAANCQRHRKGMTSDDVINSYTNWAEKYDLDLCPGRYNGPEIAAKFLANYYQEKERPHVHIIDIAAGTGRVGKELLQLGFHNIDALEPSNGMLNVAKQNNIYQQYFLEWFGTNQTSINNDTYDCLVISGGMGEGHIPTKAVDEMIRIVKPGGLVCIVMREEYLQDVSEYAGKLEPYMKELEADKQMWQLVSRTIVPNYSFLKNGVVFMYKVL